MKDRHFNDLGSMIRDMRNTLNELEDELNEGYYIESSRDEDYEWDSYNRRNRHNNFHSMH